MITSKEYLKQTQDLLDKDKYTDGCTTPFKNYIHKWLKKSHLLCAAHDFGGLGYIEGVRGGWHNNLHTLRAHWSQPNPIYWIWGTIVSSVTLPWVVWHHDLKIKFPKDVGGFYIGIGFIGYLLWMLNGILSQIN